MPPLMNQLVRYLPVLRLLNEGPAPILEVGCGAFGLAHWSARSFVGCDRSFADYADARPEVGGPMRPVRADVCRLPFRDEAFGAVLCMDTLEHLPPLLREDAMRELCRVARTRLILAFPWGEGISVWDRRLANRLRRRGRTVPAWLSEHLEVDPPDPSRVAEDLRRLGFEVSRHDGAACAAHYFLMRAEGKRHLGRALNQVSARLSDALSGRARSRIDAIVARALMAIHPVASRVTSSRRAYRTYFIAERQAALGHPRAQEDRPGRAASL
ncbi:MAG TPA: class I SAM-dependent methyltransferase [Anaeromyxobacteraceae bacterium]|nr:class I SAM-dependent methyltransferase [Anaeromyxobacteraceae bacterium]